MFKYKMIWLERVSDKALVWNDYLTQQFSFFDFPMGKKIEKICEKLVFFKTDNTLQNNRNYLGTLKYI